MPSLPTENDLVMGVYAEVHDYGAYVDLLDPTRPTSLRAFLPIGEFTRRRLRTTNWATVGHQDVFQVIRVGPGLGDETLPQIDVSRRHLVPEDLTRCKDAYAKTKVAMAILKEGLGVETAFNEADAWFTRAEQAGYDTLYAFFLARHTSLSEENERVGKAIHKHLATVLAQADQTLTVKLTCFGPDGIDAIKSILRAGMGPAEGPIRASVVVAPLYRLVGPDLSGVLDRMKARALDFEEAEVEQVADLSLGKDEVDEEEA